MSTLPALHFSSARATFGARAAWGRVVRIFESPWMAYALLFLLQLKVIWGIWSTRDVTTGDTSSYFTNAWLWYTNAEVNIAWSPLYTAYYGSFLFLNPDPVWATFAHRVGIVLAASLLVLAVFRQLLPPAIAWLCAAWWTVLPIVFNTLYEVHLFAVLPVLVVWLLLLTSRGPWRRAAALGVLGVSVVLVRNELSVPFGLLGLILAAYELRRVRRGDGQGAGQTVLAYASCLGLSAAVVAGAYSISTVKYPELSAVLEEKHTLNMAQVYAFGYQQRNPEWALSPWLECFGLMRDHFGAPLPSLREMIAANPRAVGEHFAWNLSLTPSGLQLLLFNRATGTINPDYDWDAVRRLNSRTAGVLTAAVLVLWAAGLVALWRARRDWRSGWSSARALGWAGMFAVAAVVPLVIATQRPRPSYLFALAVLLIAVTGLCLHVSTARWRLAERLRVVMPIAMVGIVLLVPRFFTPAYGAMHEQVVAKSAQRLAAHRNEFAQPGTRLAVTFQAAAWYAHPPIRFERPERIEGERDVNEEPLLVIPWLFRQRKSGETFPALLDRFDVDVAYLDEWAIARVQEKNIDPTGDLAAGRDAPGWQLVAGDNAPGDRWRLYRRVK